MTLPLRVNSKNPDTTDIIIEKVRCRNHPIFCRIVNLKPTIDKEFAMTLSNLIHKYSNKYGTDPLITVAIAMQESSLRNVNRYGTVYKSGKYIKGITDVGIYQFHVNTIRNEGLNADKLAEDLDYATEQHVKLLKKKMKLCRWLDIPLEESWSCYHSATEKHRLKYVNLVKRYL